MIRTRYNHPGTRTTHRCNLPSKAFQSEKSETMIESYLRKFHATGFLGDPQRKAVALFGDFTGMEDFQTIQNKMAKITEHFEALPSHVRRFFGDEPANYVAFVTDPRNLEKSIEMGLLTREENQNVPPPPQVVSSPSPLNETNQKQMSGGDSTQSRLHAAPEETA